MTAGAVDGRDERTAIGIRATMSRMRCEARRIGIATLRAEVIRLIDAGLVPRCFAAEGIDAAHGSAAIEVVASTHGVYFVTRTGAETTESVGSEVVAQRACEDRVACTRTTDVIGFA